jgi:hypothetical protein
MATVFQSQLSQIFFNILKTPRFWCVIIAGPCLAVLPDIYLKAYRNVFIPNPIETIIKMRGKNVPQLVPTRISPRKLVPKEEKQQQSPKSEKKGGSSPGKQKKIIPY